MAPFQLARRVLRNTWKTVTDAWNGYHNIPLRESDRHHTTFITPFGEGRYTKAPRGFLCSRDGYNRRFNAILAEFERKKCCIDDTVFHGDTLKQHGGALSNFLLLSDKPALSSVRSGDRALADAIPKHVKIFYSKTHNLRNSVYYSQTVELCFFCKRNHSTSKELCKNKRWKQKYCRLQKSSKLIQKSLNT